MRERRNFIIWPELTPLVDVVFILLIFFALSSSFLILPGVKIRLPSSGFAWKKEKNEIHITLTCDNLLFLGNKPVSWDELPLALHKYSLTLHSPLLIIQADRDVRHGKVVKLMELAREAGIKRFAIATERKEEK